MPVPLSRVVELWWHAAISCLLVEPASPNDGILDSSGRLAKLALAKGRGAPISCVSTYHWFSIVDHNLPLLSSLVSHILASSPHLFSTFLPTSEAARSRCTSPKPRRQSTAKNGKEGARRARSHQTVGERGLGRRVGEDVAQGWRLPVNIGRASEGQGQQAGCERERGSKGEECGPPESKGQDCCCRCCNGYKKACMRTAC